MLFSGIDCFEGHIFITAQERRSVISGKMHGVYTTTTIQGRMGTYADNCTIKY